MLSEHTRIAVDKLIKSIAEDSKTKNSPEMILAITELIKSLKS